MGHLNKYELGIRDIYVNEKMLVDLIKAVEDSTISVKQGKEVLYKALTEELVPTEIIKQSNMRQITDDDELRTLVIEIINDNKPMVDKYKSGKNILDFFVGQMMKKTKGQANPSKASQMFKEELDKS